MSRILQAFLLISILTTPAYSQEPDSLELLPGEGPGVQKPDTIQPAGVHAPLPRDSAGVQKPDTIQPAGVHAPLPRDSAGVEDGPGPYIQTGESDTLRAAPESDTTALPPRKAMRVQADSVNVAQPDFSHSPSKAIMYALVLPGLGQVYNRKYYKIPIVWAALGVAGYAISFNTRNYRQASLDYALVPDDTNERYLQFWRRNMELSYIGLLAVYALEVLDAYVDAQLYSWDVNDNLSLRLAPSLQPLMTPAGIGGQAYGFTCSLNLKRR
jgi:hypothetical protein